MPFDLKMIETGNGGDLVSKGNDLIVTKSIVTLVYLRLFGGNVEESTVIGSTKLQSFDWWGNTVLMGKEPTQQFNSLTERTLNNTALTSEGRQTIEDAVKEDLKFLSNLFTIFVEVSFPYINRVKIEMRFIGLESAQEGVLVINLRKELDGDFSILDFDVNDFLIL